MTEQLRIAYVCNFASPHARGLIGFFAGRTDVTVTVFSTGTAEGMEGVELIELNEANMPGKDASRLGRFLYFLSLKLPQLYRWVRIQMDIRMIAPLSGMVNERATGHQFDVIHGLRTIPEGAIAHALAKSSDTPLFLTSWGQDFVVWASHNRSAARVTKSILADLMHFLPDNARDARLAQSTLELSKSASTATMPAIGGIDAEAMEQIRAQACPGSLSDLALGEGPVLLSMRGYDNVYVKTSALVSGFSIFQKQHPGAVLIVDGPEKHPGRAHLENLAAQSGISAAVRFVHLSRADLFQLMERADLYVSATSSDGLPISVLESLYFGLFPVLHQSESVVPPIEDGVNGIFFSGYGAGPISEAFAEGFAKARAVSKPQRTATNRAMLAETFQRELLLSRLLKEYQAVRRL